MPRGERQTRIIRIIRIILFIRRTSLLEAGQESLEWLAARPVLRSIDPFVVPSTAGLSMPTAPTMELPCRAAAVAVAVAVRRGLYRTDFCFLPVCTTGFWFLVA